MVLGSGRRQAVAHSSEQNSSDVSGGHVSAGEGEDPGVLEPRVDWIRRTTHEVEEKLSKTNLKDWVSQARSRKWHWMEKVIKLIDHRWTYSVLKWDPACDKRGGRKQGRPATRWTDYIYKFLQATYNSDGLGYEDLCSVVHDTPTWQLLEASYTENKL